MFERARGGVGVWEGALGGQGRGGEEEGEKREKGAGRDEPT